MTTSCAHSPCASPSSRSSRRISRHTNASAAPEPSRPAARAARGRLPDAMALRDAVIVAGAVADGAGLDASRGLELHVSRGGVGVVAAAARTRPDAHRHRLIGVLALRGHLPRLVVLVTRGALHDAAGH